jgi:hypothetical protein
MYTLFRSYKHFEYDLFGSWRVHTQYLIWQCVVLRSANAARGCGDHAGSSGTGFTTVVRTEVDKVARALFATEILAWDTPFHRSTVVPTLFLAGRCECH